MRSSIKYSKVFALELFCANFPPDTRHIVWVIADYARNEWKSVTEADLPAKIKSSKKSHYLIYLDFPTM